MEVKAQLLKEKPVKRLNLFGSSVSKFKTFKDCKTKYKFAYIQKLPQKQWAFFSFGKFLHRILELFHKAKLEGDLDPEHILMTDCFKIAKEEFNDLTSEQIQEAKDIIFAYLKKLNTERILEKTPNILSVEREFNINLNDKILLTGFIDRVQEDSDGILRVSDYKTSSLFDKDSDGNVILCQDITKTKKYKRYKKDIFQLQTYAYVMFLENPQLEFIRCSYIMLRHNFHEITVEFTKEEAFKVENVFIEFLANVENEKLFRPTMSKLCEYCSYLDVCDSGKQYLNIVEPKFGETSW